MNITEAYTERMLELQNDGCFKTDGSLDLNDWRAEWYHLFTFKNPRPAADSKYFNLDGEAFEFYSSFDGENRSLYRAVYFVFDFNVGFSQTITITENNPDFAILENVFKQLIKRK